MQAATDALASLRLSPALSGRHRPCVWDQGAPRARPPWLRCTAQARLRASPIRPGVHTRMTRVERGADLQGCHGGVPSPVRCHPRTALAYQQGKAAGSSIAVRPVAGEPDVGSASHWTRASWRHGCACQGTPACAFPKACTAACRASRSVAARITARPTSLLAAHAGTVGFSGRQLPHGHGPPPCAARAPPVPRARLTASSRPPPRQHARLPVARPGRLRWPPRIPAASQTDAPDREGKDVTRPWRRGEARPRRVGPRA